MEAELTEIELEQFEERAAIIEFDGRVPRQIAERRALREILEGRKCEK